MTYYYARTLDLPFAQALAATRAALSDEGFGVISEIDVRETLQTKLGEEFRPYTILGACNPGLAHEALKLEDKVGTMLPCNVVVQQVAERRTEVAVIDPVASMQAIENASLKEKASEVGGKLRASLDRLRP